MQTQTRMRYVYKKQCRSCKHDTTKGCKILLETKRRRSELEEKIDEWQKEQEWHRGHPQANADECPGWDSRFEEGMKSV